MDWVKRDLNNIHRFGEKEHRDYSACQDLFTLKLHHGGEFDGKRTKYMGGKVDYIDGCDVDRISMLEITDMIRECTMKNGLSMEICYKQPSNKSEGYLVPLESDTDLLQMVLETSLIELFIVLTQDIAVENIHLHSTPTKPISEQSYNSNDDDVKDEIRRLENRIREEEGIPKIFSDEEFEKNQNRKKKMKQKKASKQTNLEHEIDAGTSKQTELEAFVDVENGSWHDDMSNKDMSDNDGDFDAAVTAKEEDKKQKKVKAKRGSRKNKKPEAKNEVRNNSSKNEEEVFDKSDHFDSEEERMAVDSEDDMLLQKWLLNNQLMNHHLLNLRPSMGHNHHLLSLK